MSDAGERREQTGRGRLATQHETQGLQWQVAGRTVVLEGSDAVLRTLEGQCHSRSDPVSPVWTMTWEGRAVTQFDDERRARLLQFVTGSFRVPVDGFKALKGQSLIHSRHEGHFPLNKITLQY